MVKYCSFVCDARNGDNVHCRRTITIYDRSILSVLHVPKILTDMQVFEVSSNVYSTYLIILGAIKDGIQTSYKYCLRHTVLLVLVYANTAKKPLRCIHVYFYAYHSYCAKVTFVAVQRLDKVQDTISNDIYIRCKSFEALVEVTNAGGLVSFLSSVSNLISDFPTHASHS